MSSSSNKTLITGGCSFSAACGENEKQTWVQYFQQKYNFDKFYHTGVGASGNEMITHRLLYSVDRALKSNVDDITLAVMWSEIERNDIFTNDWSLDMDTDNGNIMFNNLIDTNTVSDDDWKLPIELRYNPNFNITSGFIRPGRIPGDEDYYRNEKQRKWLLDYYKFYNEEYSLINTLKNILLIQNTCKENNIKCVMFVMKNIFEYVKDYPQVKYLYDMIDWDMFLFYESKYGLYEYTAINDLEFWEDNFHAKYSAHKSFIDHFDKEIQELI